MVRIIESELKCHLPGRALARLALSTCIVLAALVASAGAQPHRDDHRDRDRHFDHRDYHRDGRYYGPPPVVYGGPAYYPPPVVYGPGIGINLPGVSIGIP